MKILFVDTPCHFKNKVGFDLLCQANGIDAVKTDDSSKFGDEYDLVIIPSGSISPFLFPRTKHIMYGPQNFVFANGIWKGPGHIFPKHCFYNILSDWVRLMQEEFGGVSLPMKMIPFPVDVDRFCPSSLNTKYDCFLYFKGRKRDLLSFAEARVKALGFHYTILQYGSYTEDQYLQILRQSRFGIWIGSHESQGFALEEALSTNVPLAVWNVRSMFDEYNRENEIAYKEDQRKYKLLATSVPYWDSSCGELFYEKEEFDATVQTVSANSSHYNPREYIVKTLSPKACYERLLTVLEEIPVLSSTTETHS